MAQNRAEWDRIQERGKNWFLFSRGVLGRGLPMALVCAIGIELYLGGELPRALVEAPFLGRLALALGVFSVGGVLNAQMQWKLNQKRFGTPS
jgi:hypothetical protein